MERGIGPRRPIRPPAPDAYALMTLILLLLPPYSRYAAAAGSARGVGSIPAAASRSAAAAKAAFAPAASAGGVRRRVGCGVGPSLPPRRPTGLAALQTAAAAAGASAAEDRRPRHPRPLPRPQPPVRINVHTITKPELESLLRSWGHPPYRAGQILRWVRERGASDFGEMMDLPASLREDLRERAAVGSLEVEAEAVSADGTRKRAYRLWDGQLIESVLMPYEDGRNTACVSSQAGCAMGCVFCATGQMGFARQLTSDEIFEQVSRFSSELKAEGGRLSNVVMMGMGEPLANYGNVMGAIRRMNDELGIGARRITVSTVGVVPNIRKLAEEDVQVRLAVSLHCSTDKERTALLPANGRYGGIDELLSAVGDYVDSTRRRVTFEWALIEGKNDTPEVARQLGRLLLRHGLRRDMCHVNVIPLNPTGGYGGGPSGRRSVDAFVRVLEGEFGIGATPRVRRGIDIDAGCGQLRAAVKRREERDAVAVAAAAGGAAMATEAASLPRTPIVGVYEEGEREDEDEGGANLWTGGTGGGPAETVDFSVHERAIDLDEEEGEVVDESFDQEEADRLVALVRASFPEPSTSEGLAAEVADAQSGSAVTDEEETTTITDWAAVREAGRRRKKLLKNLRMIARLREMEAGGRALNEEQAAKVAKEGMWRAEVESLEHNLK